MLQKLPEETRHPEGGVREEAGGEAAEVVGVEGGEGGGHEVAGDGDAAQDVRALDTVRYVGLVCFVLHQVLGGGRSLDTVQ